jgi:hypothetical protein
MIMMSRDTLKVYLQRHKGRNWICSGVRNIFILVSTEYLKNITMVSFCN